MAARIPRGAPQSVDPTSLDRPGPLEQLARLGGGGGFREPSLGRSTAPLLVGADDLAHALSFVDDPLAQSLALAIACQTAYEWPKVQELAFPRILEDMENSASMRSLIAGHRRYRLRAVLYDAFHDRALLRPFRAWKEAAAAARMSESTYRELYKWVAGFLDTEAVAGATVACRALRGRARP